MAPRIGRQVIFVLAAGSLLLPSGFGQGRGGGGGAGSNSTGSTAGGASGTGSIGTGSIGTGTRGPTTTTPNGTGNPSNNPTPNGTPQPIYISGRVLLEDGTAPSESVTIERICQGSPHAEGYTDSKGYFSIQLFQANGVIQDASEVSSRSADGFGGLSGSGLPSRSLGGSSGGSSTNAETRLMGCDLQARLGGYRSQQVSLANHRAMDNPDIGTILLHRMLPTEGTTVSASSLLAPKEAHKAFEKGEEAAKKKKWDEAAKNFQKAVDLYPGYAEAWYDLGRLQAKAAPDTARISFECAMKADAKYTAPYVEMAILDVEAKKWKDVIAITDRALRLDSFDYPELFFFNAVANYYLRNSAVAEKNARQAVKLDTQHRYPQSSYLLGLVLAQRQDYTDAAEQFEAYLKLAPDAEDAPTAKKKLEQIQKISAVGAAEPKRDQ